MGVDFFLFLFIFNSPKNCNKEKNKKLCREIKNIFKKSQWKTIFSSSHPYIHWTTKKTRYTIHIHHSIYNWDVLKRRCYMLYSKQLFFSPPNKNYFNRFRETTETNITLITTNNDFSIKMTKKTNENSQQSIIAKSRMFGIDSIWVSWDTIPTILPKVLLSVKKKRKQTAFSLNCVPNSELYRSLWSLFFMRYALLYSFS